MCTAASLAESLLFLGQMHTSVGFLAPTGSLFVVWVSFIACTSFQIAVSGKIQAHSRGLRRLRKYAIFVPDNLPNVSLVWHPSIWFRELGVQNLGEMAVETCL